MAEPVTITAPHKLRALLATMKSAKEQRINMNIWDRDIEAVEGAIETIEGIRSLPRRAGPAAILASLENIAQIIMEHTCAGYADDKVLGTLQAADAILRARAAAPQVQEAATPPSIEQLRIQAFELTPADQYRLAFFIAENVGYILIGEPDHPDSPHDSAVHRYAAEYEFRGDGGDGGDYVPTENERAMIEDAIEGYIATSIALRSPSGRAGAMREALEKYGAHLPTCNVFERLVRTCSCGLEAALAAPQAQEGEPIQPHTYSPDYQAQGDCRVCGHGAEAQWHLGGSSVSRPLHPPTENTAAGEASSPPPDR